MKKSIIMLIFFLIGIIFGMKSLLGKFIGKVDISLYALYVLLFLVGIGIGGDNRIWKIVKNVNIKIFLVPLSVIIGTLLFVGPLSFFIPGISLRDSLAIVSGFGYYSLSSVLITQLRNETLGVIALLSNITREIVTLLLTPLMVKYFGKLAPIASGGATSMDITLPIITKFTGKEYAMISVFNGIILTLIVPFLITLILR
ncbi:MAG: lysine exporter LysO family protein [Candidatus Stahlbacteria bacterium]|nr:lysine exporter LysO family protein [candidate division WOR-3 bacterium]TET97966.1 MAG: lysine exporter LysO family protein [Candidatus Stahlbacteria bacterium]